VKDTGIGIPEEARDRIFDSFAQADGSMARSYGGTGLGLAICKKIVALMGGEMGVEAAPGQGAHFWFEVPLAPVEEVEAGAATETFDLHEVRVLVVDDNETNRKVVGHYLHSWGARVALSADGPEALAELRRASASSEPFDLAILDMMMPGMTGVELAREIRADASIDSLRLVLLTSVNVASRGLDLGDLEISSHLTKPVRRAELRDALMRGRDEEDAGSLEEMSTSSMVDGGTVPAFEARVLLAEDNPVNQEVAAAMLERLGCSVRVVGDGFEAVEAVTAEPFDLLFMDCQMPKMDGFQATTAIRAHESARGVSEDSRGERGTRIPIVALTAHALPGDRERCLEADMDDFVTKPFSRKDLQEVLERRIPWTRAREGERHGSPGDPDGAEPCSRSISESVLDAAALDDLRALQSDSGSDFLSRIIDTFLENSNVLAREIRDANETGNSASMARAAHALKSSSAQLGAGRLSALCKEIEARGRAQSSDGIADLIQEFDAELELAQEALAAEQLGGC
jgi:CheY-like chemotaxis protein/HPt (histidine-containing phosphotransfer) domain-containing protein